MYKPYSFKITSFYCLFIAGLLLSGNSRGQNVSQKRTNTPGTNGLKWQVNPLDHQIFVQNSGQLNGLANTTDKILFQAAIGNAKAYFTAKGVIYSYDGSDKKALKKSAVQGVQYLTVEWENANPNVSVIAGQEQTYYYTYPNGANGTIKASVFKKITYRNIYPGIDVEYIFPGGKEGIKYALIVHPGADLSQVKLKYDGAKNAHFDEAGNIVVNTNLGDFTDHAPVSYYKDGGTIDISYVLNGTEESFVANKAYNESATIVIDPWTTTPIFAGSYDKAYDIDYDDNGNVYAYGGYNPFQLVKIDNTGAIKWTFNASTIDPVIYGDFAVDKTTGTSYIVEGAHATGARVLKVNTLGVLKATFPGDTSTIQMWRAVMNPCNHTLVIGAGENVYQACTLDTSFSKLTKVNVLGATAPGHTMTLTAIDPSSDTCYMATAKDAAVDTAKFKNVLVKMPLSSLTPTSYIVPDGYKFVQLASVNYAGPGIGTANGFNGMAVSPNWLYMSDGSTLNQVNKNTGAIVKSAVISGTSFSWGGLDADICDNVYAGTDKSINIYSSSMILTGTIGLPGTVYDVVLGPNQKTLYAGGNAFVTAFNIASSVTVSNTIVAAQCGCNGSAKATLTACGKIDTASLSYKWSNGQTTQTATNLCAGTYTLSISTGCSIIFQDTVVVPSHFMILSNQSPTTCAGASGVVVTANGGVSYTWSPSTGLSSTNTATVTANPPVTTTYKVVGVNGVGCKDSATVIVTVVPKPNVVLASSAIIVCPGTADSLKATGATTYSWSPAGSLNCNPCSNPISYVSTTTTFTVVGTTSGCNDTAQIIVKVHPVPTITVKTTPTACDSFNGTATAIISGAGPYSYSWSPKGGTGATATGLGAGSYAVSVVDSNGCVFSQVGVVAITVSPTVTATSSVATCDSTNGKAMATVVSGTPPFTYLWSPGGGTNINDNNLGAGIYTITVVDKNGCKATAFTIIQDTGDSISFLKHNNVSCFGGSDGGATATMIGGTSPYSYVWSPVGETTSAVSNLSIGQYTVTATDVHNCKVIDTITISQPTELKGIIGPINILNASCFGASTGKMSVNASGGISPYTYTWSNAQTGDTASGLSAGTYTVTIKDLNSCTVTVTDTIKQPSPLVLVSGSSAATCGNNGSANVVVTGGTPLYTYNWSGGAGNAATVYGLNKGTYTVTVTDSHGCTDTASTVIDTIGQTATIKASINVLCNGGNTGSATVSVIVGDTSLYGYLWYPSGETNATATGLSAGIDSVYVTYLGNLCQVKVYDTIKQPPALTSVIKYTLECGNRVIASDSSAGGVPAYTYFWSPSGGSGPTANIGSGSYTLTVTDKNNCTNVVPLVAPTTDPVANFKVVPDTVLPGDSVKFVNLSTGATSWYWTFGEGGSSTDSLPSYVYNNGGSFVVWLKVTNAMGCSDSIAVTIYVKEGIIVPNVFTPNGDGINDVFHVNAYGVNNYKIDIYDRWGLLIFEGTGPDNDWTGRTMAGEQVSGGVYYYIITATDNKGKSFNTKGFVELIR